jgi:PIN like domain
MGDPKKRSQKRSSGKQAKRPLKNFTLYLDESLDCEEVRNVLSSANIKFRCCSEDFKKGEEDSTILHLAGKHGWAMLTHDTKNRYRELERRNILSYRVRQFIFTANLGGHALAQLLVNVYPKMRHFARENGRPFVAVVTKSGDIYLRMDSQGKVSGGSRLGAR